MVKFLSVIPNVATETEKVTSIVNVDKHGAAQPSMIEYCTRVVDSGLNTTLSTGTVLDWSDP